MSARPWFNFYPSDWQGDPALGACSLAARGLWVEMLCIMHGSDERGRLMLNGKPIGLRVLTQMARAIDEPMGNLLSELRENGVFSEENGVIYSRRMIREAEKSEAGRVHAAKRWGESGEQNQSVTGAPKGKVNGAPIGLPKADSRARGRAPATSITKTKESGVLTDSLPPQSLAALAPASAEKAKGKPRKPIPESWRPSAKNRADAIERGMPEAAIPGEAEKFVDWHRQHGTMAADIDSTWRTWCRNYAAFKARDAQSGGGSTFEGYVP